MIDKPKMVEQENKDFITTQKIMQKIFAAYNKSAKLKQNPIYSPIDAQMVVNNKKYYAVEIKERQQDMEIYNTLPLKVSKYCNILESKGEDETPLIIYLVNNEEYYIFNLEKLDLNKCTICNWFINKVEFTQNQQKDKQPTIFMPINQCVYNGNIN